MRQTKLFLLSLLFILILPACQEAVTPTPTPSPQPLPTTIPVPTDPPSKLPAGTAGYPWWNDTVFYEVFVRSFYDSDGDGIGDLSGLIEKLDYLNDGNPATTDDLGITGLWLMPITQSPSYHGYDVVDYYNVDDEYGTNEDFLRLMDEAHQRGIRVIVDLVLNHTGRDHEWFQASRNPDSPYRDWYVWQSEDPGWRGPAGQKVWIKQPSGFYYAVFWDGMPDLNYHNPDVTAQMYDVSRFWLEEMGVDGFRLDAIKHMIEDERIQENSNSTHAWLEAYFTFYKSVNPDAFAVGEAWTSTGQVLDYTGDEVDVAFQFDLAEDILNSANAGIGSIVMKTMSEIVEAFPPHQYATFLTNHDQNRVMNQLQGDEGAAKVAASFLLTAPGTPFIYYGEEIGMSGSKPDEDIRRPLQWDNSGYRAGFTSGMPWRPPAPDHDQQNIAYQLENADSLLSHYRGLIQLRNGHEALRVGDWIPVETKPARVAAFIRQTEAETLLVIINFGKREAKGTSLSLPASSLPASPTLTTLFGDGELAPLAVNENGGFTDYVPVEEMPAQSTLIIQITP